MNSPLRPGGSKEAGFTQSLTQKYGLKRVHIPAVVFPHVALALVKESVGGTDSHHVVAGAVRVAEFGPLAMGMGRAHHALTARPHPELTH